MNVHFTVTAEIDATDFFDSKGADWEFCNQHATFRHKEANVFILHCGSDEDGDCVKDTVAAMTEFGCTDDFIIAYHESARQGAVRVIFYA